MRKGFRLTLSFCILGAGLAASEGFGCSSTPKSGAPFLDVGANGQNGEADAAPGDDAGGSEPSGASDDDASASSQTGGMDDGGTATSVDGSAAQTCRGYCDYSCGGIGNCSNETIDCRDAKRCDIVCGGGACQDLTVLCNNDAGSVACYGTADASDGTCAGLKAGGCVVTGQ